MNKCRYNIDHEPQYLNEEGYCIHVEMDIWIAANQYKERRIIWNWREFKWDEEQCVIVSRDLSH